MQKPITLWYIDGDSPARRRARIEIIGKTFMLYEQEWRSGPYYFGDLVYRGKKDDLHIYGLEDGIKDRPQWQLQVKGDIPPELAPHLPGQGGLALSKTGMSIIAVLILAIVYLVAG